MCVSFLYSDWLSEVVVGVSSRIQEEQAETNTLAERAHGVYTRVFSHRRETKAAIFHPVYIKHANPEV